MKYILNIKTALLLACFMGFFACEIDDLPNPNGPSIDGVLTDATSSQLQILVTGAEEGLRGDISFYYDVVSIIGREYYFFTGSDPRYTGEILGRGDATLDNAGFYGNRPYFGRYRTIRNLNVLIEAAMNSSTITEQELQGYLGFAKTIQAYELHIVNNLQFQNGIRVDVADIDNLGGFVTYEEGLAETLALLDDALVNLNAAGEEFPFSLSGGFTGVEFLSNGDLLFPGFDNPINFAQFNRALSARIALYQGNNADAISRIQTSFFDPMAPLTRGPSRFYSSAGGDFANNIFRVPGQNDAIIAHPSFLEDAESGDNRLGKILLRQDANGVTDTLALDGLSGTHDVWVFRSLEDQVPLINNEELGLILAEANIGIDNGMTVNLINWVRGNAGLGDYTGGTSDAELVDEVLNQRRYSLYALGHRWVDMRRFNRLDQLPLDRDGDDVFPQLPRPVDEL